jgi:septum site-determining protein MinD
MGLENRIVYDLVDVIEGRCKLRQAMIRDKRLEGLYLLPAAQTRDKTAVSPSDMVLICDELRTEFDYVLIDSPAGIERGFRNAIAPADEVIILTNPEVSSVRDSDRMIGILSSKSRRAEQNLEGIREYLLVTRYSPERVQRGEMLALEDVQEILSLDLIGVIPESISVLNSSNAGVPVILDRESSAGQAYSDMVSRYLGDDLPHRFLSVQKKGLFGRLFGG